MIAGKYFLELNVTPAGSSLHRYLDMVGDNAAAIDISAAQVTDFRIWSNKRRRCFTPITTTTITSF